MLHAYKQPPKLLPCLLHKKMKRKISFFKGLILVIHGCWEELVQI